MKRVRIVLVLFLCLSMYTSAAFAVDQEFWLGLSEVIWNELEYTGAEKFTALKTDGSPVIEAEYDDSMTTLGYWQWQNSIIITLDESSATSLLAFITQDPQINIPGFKIGDPLSKAMSVIPGKHIIEQDKDVWLNDNYFLMLEVENNKIVRLTYMKMGINDYTINEDYTWFLSQTENTK